MLFRNLASLRHLFLSKEDRVFLNAIQSITGQLVYNVGLYKLAVNHSSAAVVNFHGIKESNERLEYLGDAVLGMVVADYLFTQFPFKDEGFDLAVNNLSLHHFTWENAVAITRAIYKSARLGFLINDLHRSRIAHAVIFLLTRIFTRNRLTRYDAPVSVMNAFTPSEFRELAQSAEIEPFEIHRHFPYRIAFLGKKK